MQSDLQMNKPEIGRSFPTEVNFQSKSLCPVKDAIRTFNLNFRWLSMWVKTTNSIMDSTTKEIYRKCIEILFIAKTIE
jgi:hypothetical protein